MAQLYTYWHISNGLRGCYMPDSARVVRVSTRRALKSAIAEQDPSDDAPGNRVITSLAAQAWRIRNDRRFNLSMCAAYPRNAGYGLFVGPATKAEWLAAEGDAS